MVGVLGTACGGDQPESGTVGPGGPQPFGGEEATGDGTAGGAASGGPQGATAGAGTNGGGTGGGTTGTTNGGSAGATAGASKPAAVLRVHYPTTGHTLALRGSAAGLNWTSGAQLTTTDHATWTFTWATLTSPVEVKPLVDDATWSRGPNYVVRPGQEVDLYPHFFTTAGSVSKRWPAFTSSHLAGTRGVWVYLPPTYGENTDARFPVLYMQDGANLFDGGTAFGGNEWHVDEALNQGAEDGTVREAIVIGVEATAARIDELTPTYDPSRGQGGQADGYLDMLVADLKPMVDAQYRTLPGRDTTGLAGSSLGGLVSAYGGVRHADVFGLVGAFSPSTWWGNRVIVSEVQSTPTRPAKPVRVYVDSGDGGNGSGDDKANTALLAQTYRDVGYVDGQSLKYVMQPGGTHSEVYWSQRFPAAATFLLGPRPDLALP